MLLLPGAISFPNGDVATLVQKLTDLLDNTTIESHWENERVKGFFSLAPIRFKPSDWLIFTQSFEILTLCYCFGTKIC